MKPELLSSVYGEITEVLIVFPGIPTQASEWEYKGIEKTFDEKGTVHRFKQEAPGCTIRVAQTSFRGDDSNPLLGNVRSINDISANMNLLEVLSRWKTELEYIDRGDRLSYRRWAQDPFVTMATEDAVILLQSYYTQRLTDYLLPLQLAEQAGRDFLLKPTRLYLEGGNILCSWKRAYIGKDLLQQNMTLLALSEQDVLAHLKQTMGVAEIKVVGFTAQRQKWMAKPDEGNLTWQPLFHIDLFMTLGGKDKGTGRELIFLANPNLSTHVLQTENNTVKRAYLPKLDTHLEAGLEEVKAHFPGNEYRVVDLPIYILNGTCYSWNNCLVEITETTKRVYLPSYVAEIDDQQLNPTFTILEARVDRCYRDEGFEPIWIRSGGFFRIISSHGGSLHCVTKVLRRDAYVFNGG
jgi:hypothetical protein